MRHETRHGGVLLSVIAAVALVIACGGPKVPSCESDEQCDAEGRKGVCVDHRCVACRDDLGCAAGESCREGRCARREGYCDESTACPGGAPCTNHQCGAPAAKPAVECDDEHPCRGPGEHCQNGHCVAPEPGGPGCRDFGAVYYAFESADVATDARRTLERLAGCLAKGSLAGRKVLLTGHCDARGEYEFNMALGAERAERARALLLGLGVTTEQVTTSSRGKLDAVGADEDGMAKDRRVDIEVR